MIKKGTRLRFMEYGKPCCECPGMDALNLPEGYHVRVGKGTQPGAFHQDCALFEANKDRFGLVPYVTNAGVEIDVIQIVGDGYGRTGGAYGLKLLDNPCTWESGQGIRARVHFSPTSPLSQDWYFNIELRGELSRRFKNESASCVLFAVKNDRIKVAYFLNNEDGEGGGQRFIWEAPYKFRRNNWYALEIALLPDLTIENTWDLNVRLGDLKRENNFAVFVPGVDERPNRIKAITVVGMGDEQQGLESGGTFLVSVNEDAGTRGKVTI